MKALFNKHFITLAVIALIWLSIMSQASKFRKLMGLDGETPWFAAESKNEDPSTSYWQEETTLYEQKKPAQQFINEDDILFTGKQTFIQSSVQALHITPDHLWDKEHSPSFNTTKTQKPQEINKDDAKRWHRLKRKEHQLLAFIGDHRWGLKNQALQDEILNSQLIRNKIEQSDCHVYAARYKKAQDELESILKTPDVTEELVKRIDDDYSSRVANIKKIQEASKDKDKFELLAKNKTLILTATQDILRLEAAALSFEIDQYLLITTQQTRQQQKEINLTTNLQKILNGVREAQIFSSLFIEYGWQAPEASHLNNIHDAIHQRLAAEWRHLWAIQFKADQERALLEQASDPDDISSQLHARYKEYLWQHLQTSDNANQRLAAIQELRESFLDQITPHTDTVSRLVEVLKNDQSFNVRRATAKAISAINIKDPSAIDAVKSHLDDPRFKSVTIKSKTPENNRRQPSQPIQRDYWTFDYLNKRFDRILNNIPPTHDYAEAILMEELKQKKVMLLMPDPDNHWRHDDLEEYKHKINYSGNTWDNLRWERVRAARLEIANGEYDQARREIVSIQDIAKLSPEAAKRISWHNDAKVEIYDMLFKSLRDPALEESNKASIALIHEAVDRMFCIKLQRLILEIDSYFLYAQDKPRLKYVEQSLLSKLNYYENIQISKAITYSYFLLKSRYRLSKGISVKGLFTYTISSEWRRFWESQQILDRRLVSFFAKDEKELKALKKKQKQQYQIKLWNALTDESIERQYAAMYRMDTEIKENRISIDDVKERLRQILSKENNKPIPKWALMKKSTSKSKHPRMLDLAKEFIR